MKKINKHWLAICLTAVLLGAGAPLVGWSGISEPWLAPDQATSGRSDLYRAGQQALDSEDWEEAERLFGQVGDQGGADADAALYWQAYAQLKRGRKSSALRTLETLTRTYPDSSWIDDARALEVEARGAGSEQVLSASEEDEQLKLYALNSLMTADSERALPILNDFLQGNHSLELKKKALFVLAMSDSPASTEILKQIAKGERQPELAVQAIEYLGLQGGAESGRVLQEIYSTSTDFEAKSKALEAMMLGDYKEMVLAAARGEQDVKLRGKAVEMLGVMDATAELRELYQTESSPEIKAKLVEGFFIADDVDTLTEIARTDADPKLRRKAIEGLGIVDSPQARKELAALYESEQDPDTRGKILESFMIAADAGTLEKLARTEADPALRRKAIEMLGVVDSPPARAALVDLYQSEQDRDTKGKILEAFMIADDVQALIDVIGSEQDRELRKKALEYLSLMDSDEAMAYLMKVLEE